MRRIGVCLGGRNAIGAKPLWTRKFRNKVILNVVRNFLVRRYNTGRSLIDAIFSITIILVFLGVFATYCIINIEEARSVALENGLTNLRNSLELYIILEGRYPEDLRELDRGYLAIKENNLYGRKYLELQAQDEQGYPIDPYGRRFIYDSKTGKVEGGIK